MIYMKWHYLIPHEWPAGDRTPWAEIWLLPSDNRFEGRSAAITIDAIGDPEDPSHGDDRKAFQVDARKKLAGKPYYINGQEMIVDVRDFNRSEFLEWVKIWVATIQAGPVELERGHLKEFLGTNSDAITVERLIREYPRSSSIENLDEHES